MIEKLNRLLAYHRKNVFEEHSGDAHHRAILRLKRTRTFVEYCKANREAADARRSERILSMYA